MGLQNVQNFIQRNISLPGLEEATEALRHVDRVKVFPLEVFYQQERMDILPPADRGRTRTGMVARPRNRAAKSRRSTVIRK